MTILTHQHASLPARKSDHVAGGNTTAMELWNRIQAPSYRYTNSQRNRTLVHPSLPQPSPDEERLNLLDKEKYLDKKKFYVDTRSDSTQEKQFESEEQALRARLTSALEKAHVSTSMDDINIGGNGEICADNLSSPTSTLHFPDRSVDYKATLRSQQNLAGAEDFSHDCEYDEPDQIVCLECFDTTKQKHSELTQHSKSHSFVVTADTQIGMTSGNEEWETELEYSRQAVRLINSLSPLPSFVCVCGDLVDMEYSFHTKSNSKFTRKQCDEIQDRQNSDLQDVWSDIDDRIALVCLCGNHDVGNRPTKASIDRFRSAWGDDYLAFWTNGCYNIVLNSNLFSDPSGAPDMFDEQMQWLENRLHYANAHDADQIFVFGHHPWFLYHEDEEAEDLEGLCPFPKEWGENDDPSAGFPDRYFHIRRKYRDMALKLFKKYGVSASFSGHFHQNLVSKTSWGMDMIVTAPLSIVFESDGKPKQEDENMRGVRIVTVKEGRFSHRFQTL